MRKANQQRSKEQKSSKKKEEKKRDKEKSGKQKKGMFPGLGEALGKAAGGIIGGEPGAWFGKQAGGWLGRITGLGSYRVSKNSLLDSQGPPLFRESGTTVLTHREFIGDVTSSTGFNSENFAINPGQPLTFPWLSQIAQRFEQYELLGLIFEFKTTSATAVASTNTALGTVVMSTMYNSAEPSFANKAEMEAYEFTTSCAPDKTMIHPVECKRDRIFNPTLYVRSHTVPADADINTYDHGRFTIATVGMQAASVIGELWVSYHIRLIRPKLESSVGSGVYSAFKITCTNAGVMSTTETLAECQSVGISASNPTFTITLAPNSHYRIDGQIRAANGVNVTGLPGWTPDGTGCNWDTSSNFFPSDTVATARDYINAIAVPVSNQADKQAFVYTNANPGYITGTYPTAASGTIYYYVQVTQVTAPLVPTLSLQSKLSRLENLIARLDVDRILGIVGPSESKADSASSHSSSSSSESLLAPVVSNRPVYLTGLSGEHHVVSPAQTSRSGSGFVDLVPSVTTTPVVSSRPAPEMAVGTIELLRRALLRESTPGTVPSR